jgi:hypothetical protein
MNHKIWSVLAPGLILMLTWSAGLSQAQAVVVGTVKTVTGDAWVITAQQSVKAKVGTEVHLGSKLKTAKSASMGVTFKDNTLMSFGPDTEMTVDEFLFAPTQGQLKLGTRLDKGSLNYVSGLIAKLKPEAVTVTTPTGTIGVRGTQFLVNVEDPAKVN